MSSMQVVTAPSFVSVTDRYFIHVLWLIRRGRNTQQMDKLTKDTEMRKDT